MPPERQTPPEPDVLQHRDQALHNEKLLDNAFLPPDWEITIRFYATAHWVRAFLKKRLKVPSISSHEEADKLLAQASVQKDIRQLFKELRWASEDARYYCVHPSPNQLERFRKAHDRLKGFFEPKSKP
ncbi:hypothetical protein KZX47_11660 [Thermus sp. SYSU G05001]|uniref:HEPN domain-containing protein n=1 Tax=Thermus brevis TaxID=2862456 RepID=A0ABS7A0I2_9DEIN|nr:hypothetical protein [Thermus brevis]MBW6395800.1 hypothetical protein [Thermus brevis]